ncbi:CdaR family protein [Ureibacillus composti]|nr:CdaR family protein [Ureibacillus composti]
MDKLFDSYWVLRVTALVLAILLFLYVKAELNDDDQNNTTSNTDVDIITDVELEVYYDDENLIVSGLPKTVDVTIEGPKPIVLQTKLAKDFKVFVDLNSLLIGEHQVTIDYENLSDKLDVSIEPKTVDVVIEEKVTAEMRVEPEMNNRLIHEGYELNGMIADPGTVFITGAKSVIESISYVKATVTGEPGIKAPFEQNANVKVLDSNLNKLDVVIEPESVKVKVDVYEYKREIPIVIKQKGSPPKGVTIRRLISESNRITVYGPKSIIDAFAELVVEFDVSEIEESKVYKVDLSLPNGATRLSSKTIDIQVDLNRVVPKVEPEETPTTSPNNTNNTGGADTGTTETETETDVNVEDNTNEQPLQ